MALREDTPEELLQRKQEIERNIQALDKQTRRTIEENGFSIQGLVEILMKGEEGVAELAREKGYIVTEENRLGKGGTKLAFLQPDGKVLKLETVDTYLTSVLEGRDEPKFCSIVEQKLGRENARLVLAHIGPAAPGVPGTLQERIFPTSHAMRIVKEGGDTALHDQLLQAHKSNPLAKHYVFEQNWKNSGLALRDGKIYIVAFDVSDGVDIDHVEGGWDTVKADMAGIQYLKPEVFAKYPKIMEWLQSQTSH